MSGWVALLQMQLDEKGLGAVATRRLEIYGTNEVRRRRVEAGSSRQRDKETKRQREKERKRKRERERVKCTEE